MRGPPVFIVGCGRSGTTALGRLLGTHSQVTYLNEPRNVWRIDPRTDVWSEGANHTGRIDLYDVEQQVRSSLRNAFFKLVDDGTMLVEKTPVNSFRLDYIRQLFPRARFLHLLRSGLDVARSIERWVGTGRTWYGKGDSKWHLLTDYAAREGLGDLAAWAGHDPRRRGLLEWRLAVAHVRRRLDDRDCEVRYEDLTARPDATLKTVIDWLGLDQTDLDTGGLASRSEPITEVDADAALVAGRLLADLGYPTSR